MTRSRRARGGAFVCARLALERPIVDTFAAHRVTEFGEMNADLMGTAGLEAARDERVMRQSFFCMNVRDGGFAVA